MPAAVSLGKRHFAIVLWAAVAFAALFSGGPAGYRARAAAPPVDVLMRGYNPAGTGANLRETILAPRNVNSSHFGKLFSYELEGFIYAQPLLVTGIAVDGKVRNVLYVATTNNLVYALDADDPGFSGGLLWMERLTQGGAFPVPGNLKPDGPLWDQTVHGNMGILGTPVISRARGAIYLVARTMEGSRYDQFLYALDLATGKNKVGPVRIETPAVTPGHAFDERVQANRAGLTLARDRIVVAFTAIPKDATSYQGWVLAFNPDTLARTGVFCSTCTSDPGILGGGIWQAGRPPAVDADGYVYVFTGNGWLHGIKKDVPPCTVGEARPPNYLAESVVKLDAADGLAIKASWTADNWCELDGGDVDLGSSGPAVIGGERRSFLVGGGKQGRSYSFDLSTFNRRDVSRASQQFCAIDPKSANCPGGHHIMSGPVYWPRRTRQSWLYLSLENDRIRRFPVEDGLVDPTHAATVDAVNVGHPASFMALSADGEKPGTGILWASAGWPNSDRRDGAVFNTVHGRLTAYDAETLKELWNSDQLPARDNLGYFAKFVPPVVANGRVYIPAFPAPEPYRDICYCDQGAAVQCGQAGCQVIRQAFHAPNNRGYLIVYGPNPPAAPPVRSFVSDILPAVLAPLTDDPGGA